MSCRHELGQGEVSEDGIIWLVDLGDVEVDELGVVVVMGPEGEGRRICPRGRVKPPPTPEKGLVGRSRPGGTCSRPNASVESTLRPAPPSARVLVTATLQMVGVQSNGALLFLPWSLDGLLGRRSPRAHLGSAY